MAAVYTILERFRLEHYYKGFLDIGVTDERDFVDSVADEDLDKMGKVGPQGRTANKGRRQAVWPC